MSATYRILSVDEVEASPKARLNGFKGTIQADAYQVYPCIERDLPQIKRLGCLAHSRRRFYKAALEGDRQAIWFIAQMRNLYRIERESVLMTPEARHQYRQDKNARVIWEQMKIKGEELQPKLLPQSSLGKALSYYLNEYQPMVRYLEKGKYQIDNNLIICAKTRSGQWLLVANAGSSWAIRMRLGEAPSLTQLS